MDLLTLLQDIVLFGWRLIAMAQMALLKLVSYGLPCAFIQQRFISHLHGANLSPLISHEAS